MWRLTKPLHWELKWRWIEIRVLFPALTNLRAIARLTVRTAFQAWVVAWTAVLGAVATFLVMSVLGLTEAPPSAVLEAPRWLEEQLGWVARAAEYWCRSQPGCAD